MSVNNYEEFFAKRMEEKGKELSSTTKKNYIGCFNKIVKDHDNKSIDNLIKDDSKLFDYIKSLQIKDGAKKNKLFMLSLYIKVLHKDLVNKSVIVNYCNKLSNDNEVVANVVVVEHKEADPKVLTLQDLQQKVLDVNNKQDKLVLSLLTNYNSLRTDLVNIKLKDYDDKTPHYKDGFIVYPQNSLMKVKNTNILKIKLNEEDKNAVESLNTEYLVEFKKTTTDRNNSFSKLVSSLSKKYFGETITLTRLRHLHTNEKVDFIDDSFKEKFKRVLDLAKSQNHSVETMMSHYYK